VTTTSSGDQPALIFKLKIDEEICPLSWLWEKTIVQLNDILRQVHLFTILTQLEYGIRVQKIGDHYRVYKKIFTGSGNVCFHRRWHWVMMEVSFWRSRFAERGIDWHLQKLGWWMLQMFWWNGHVCHRYAVSSSPLEFNYSRCITLTGWKRYHHWIEWNCNWIPCKVLWRGQQAC